MDDKTYYHVFIRRSTSIFISELDLSLRAAVDGIVRPYLADEEFVADKREFNGRSGIRPEGLRVIESPNSSDVDAILDTEEIAEMAGSEPRDYIEYNFRVVDDGFTERVVRVRGREIGLNDLLKKRELQKTQRIDPSITSRVLQDTIESSNASFDGKKVFIVHGRDHITKTAMSALLREVGLDVVTWEKAKSLTGIGSPFTLDVVKHGIAEADAVVVLITPDDEGRTKSEFEYQANRSSPDESPLYGQARQNVVYEAGMAFGVKPKSTVIVEFGSVRSLSDLDGVQVIKMASADEKVKREQLLNALRNAGLTITETGTDWLTTGDFKLERFDQSLEPEGAPHMFKGRNSKNAVALAVLEALYQETATEGNVDEQTIQRYHEILSKPGLDEGTKIGLEISKSHYHLVATKIPIMTPMGDEVVGYNDGEPVRKLKGSIFRSKLREAIETIKQGEMIRG